MTVARIAAALGAAGLMVSAAVAVAAPASATDVESCQDGVFVVVDFSDLGGEVETGCAQGDPESGREALESAGFTPLDGSVAGLVCTIDGQPDPCPVEFDGSFWAYWQVVDGEWVSSQVGLDEADPTPGGIEGWRYNDGSVPPPLPAAAEAEATDPEATEAETAESETADSDATDLSEESEGVNPLPWIAGGVIVLAVVIGLVLRAAGARTEKEARSSGKK